MHVVIIGFDRREHARGEKRLFSYDTVKGEPEETTHKVLSPYHYLCEKYAQFVNFAHPFVGSREYLQGGER